MLKYHPVFPIIVLSKGKWGDFFMKINKTEKIMGIYINNMSNKIKGSKKNSVKKDELDFSDRAKDFQFALEKIKSVPDMRMDRVERLKREVKSGTYNVEGRKIAEKILETIDFDKRI